MTSLLGRRGRGGPGSWRQVRLSPLTLPGPDGHAGKHRAPGRPIGGHPVTSDHRHCFRQFSGAVWRKIESRFIRFFSVPLKSVKLIHFLTKLKCFVLPAESRVTGLGPLSSGTS